MPRPRIIVLVGATATGKTSLSIRLAKALGGEIISADSRQVYRGLNVGTGKVTKMEMDGVPHHLIDVASPKRVFTAAAYVRLGRRAIDDIISRGKVPIVIGGTGFYIDALLGRRPIVEVPPNPTLRKTLDALSLAELQRRLKRLDPKRYKTIDRMNPRRLIRAIEIASAPRPPALNAKLSTLNYAVTWIGLAYSRAELKERIIARLHERLKKGMLAEARRLHKNGLSWKRMEELGLEYRYLARHLQKKITYDQMVTQLESEIYKYSKRQVTWFKANPDIHWFDANTLTLPAQVLALFS